MEDFDIFTNEITYTKELQSNILNKYLKDLPPTPIGANYQSAHKLKADELKGTDQELLRAFHLSEAVSASLRIMSVYKHEQMKISGKTLQSVKNCLNPIQKIIDDNPLTKKEKTFLNFLSVDAKKQSEKKSIDNAEEDVPLHIRYLRFSEENNVDNFKAILKSMPEEWTIVQLTAPYNPNENLKPLQEYQIDINSFYITIMRNEFLEDFDSAPLTVHVPANKQKLGERPLFTELHSVLKDNYNAINFFQVMNSRLNRTYWRKREEIDLRMKSVINVMDREWLGGWSSLLTGKLLDKSLHSRIIDLVTQTASDWGLLKLTTKQKIFLCNLISSCITMTSQSLRSCIRRILTEFGNDKEVRSVLDTKDCENCSSEFRAISDLCLKCLSQCFEKIHKCTLVDGIKAYYKAATVVREDEEWASLKNATRHPVILILDEILDPFPWETMPTLNRHPVARIDNIHFLYHLYKTHEKKIDKGYYIAKADVGRYIINPDKSLERMENRMTSFINYWCSDWKGHAGSAPDPETFLKYLTEADIFLYCGHGDGCHLSGGGGGAVRSTRACVVLAGCGSARLRAPAPRAPPRPAARHLHAAGAPLVLGMLWEVTDLEVDKVVSALLARGLPSDAPVPWAQVRKASWSQGILEIDTDKKREAQTERDLLRALCWSRGSSEFIMIGSSMVARGLPVRIDDTGKPDK